MKAHLKLLTLAVTLVSAAEADGQSQAAANIDVEQAIRIRDGARSLGSGDKLGGLAAGGKR